MVEDKMSMIERLLKKIYTRRDKRHLIISKTLVYEIRKAQDLMKKKHYKKTGKRARVNLLQASDYVADVFRKERYKIQK